MATEINMTADVFIIPNGIKTLKDFWVSSIQESYAEFIKTVLELNPGHHEEEISKLPLVQLWWVSTTGGAPSENIVCHGIKFPGHSKLYSTDTIMMEHLPTYLFDGKKEGDSLMIKIPVGDDLILNVNATLRQRKYRYGNFGDFDELLQRSFGGLLEKKG